MSFRATDTGPLFAFIKEGNAKLKEQRNKNEKN
jgi:hypothetical protein